MTDTIGPQLDRAAAGTDPRGELTFAWLPENLQRQEDATAFADYDRLTIRRGGRGHQRPATAAEVTLLRHLGYVIEDPDSLVTLVKYKTKSVRHRSWPSLQNQEIEP